MNGAGVNDSPVGCQSGAPPAPQGGKSRRLDQKEFPKSPARQAVWGFLVPFYTIQVRATYATYAPQSDKYGVQTGFKWGSKKPTVMVGLCLALVFFGEVLRQSVIRRFGQPGNDTGENRQYTGKPGRGQNKQPVNVLNQRRGADGGDRRLCDGANRRDFLDDSSPQVYQQSHVLFSR